MKRRTDSQHAIEFGHQGEEAVADILKMLGYDVKPGQVNGADLIINDILTCEVKVARASSRVDRKAQRWQFSLRCHFDRSLPIREHILILRCELHTPCHFVIPVMALPEGLTKIDITNPNPWKYAGRWAEFREAWEVIDRLEQFCRPEKKEIDIANIVPYANKIACDAVQDMPRGLKREQTFALAWDKACKERIRRLREGQ